MTLMDVRYGRVQWGKGSPRSFTSDSYWKNPLKWNKAAAECGQRHRVFCASLADVFDEEIEFEWFRRLLKLIQATPHLDWLLLTKRDFRLRMLPRHLMELFGVNQLPNIWLGVSAENQAYWNRRVSRLLEIPAVVRFVSVEPMLGPIELNGLRPDWVICGGESGPGARAMDTDWPNGLQRECHRRDIPFFFKQWGGVRKKLAGRLLNGQTYDEIPAPRIGQSV